MELLHGPAPNVWPARMTAPCQRQTSLIYADKAGASRILAYEITARGGAFVVVSNPLDAVVILQRLEGGVDAFFVSFQDDTVQINSFLAFLSDLYPAIRRIVFGEDRPESVREATSCGPHHGMVLWDRRDYSQLRLALGQALA